jgi:hypothetical protein
VFRIGFLLRPSSRAKGAGAGAGGTVVGMSEGGGEYVGVEPVGVSSIWGVTGWVDSVG